MLLFVVLFCFHMKIHARMSDVCQARVRRGTSLYCLQMRERILSLASYLFLYIYSRFLLQMAGENTPSNRAYFISPLKISLEWRERILIPYRRILSVPSRSVWRLGSSAGLASQILVMVIMYVIQNFSYKSTALCTTGHFSEEI